MCNYYRYNSINIRIHSNHSAINDTDTTMDYKYLLIYVAGLFTCGNPALLIFIGQQRWETLESFGKFQDKARVFPVTTVLHTRALPASKQPSVKATWH